MRVRVGSDRRQTVDLSMLIGVVKEPPPPSPSSKSEEGNFYFVAATQGGGPAMRNLTLGYKYFAPMGLLSLRAARDDVEVVPTNASVTRFIQPSVFGDACGRERNRGVPRAN